MATEYTRGPLKVQGTQEKTVIGGKYVVAADGEAPTAYVTGNDYAQLFSAAPELLEAAKSALEVFEAMDHDDIVCAIDLRAAIAKAEAK